MSGKTKDFQSKAVIIILLKNGCCDLLNIEYVIIIEVYISYWHDIAECFSERNRINIRRVSRAEELAKLEHILLRPVY